MGIKDKKLKKEQKRMAVLTAKCERAFIVSKEKAHEFNQQKKSEELSAKNKALIDKISSQIKMDDNK